MDLFHLSLKKCLFESKTSHNWEKRHRGKVKAFWQYRYMFLPILVQQAEKMKKAAPSQEYCRLLCLELIFLWHALPTCTAEELQPYLTGKWLDHNFIFILSYTVKQLLFVCKKFCEVHESLIFSLIFAIISRCEPIIVIWLL